MNWAGEDWLIVGLFALGIIAVSGAVWFGWWITGDEHNPLTPPKRTGRHVPDEHEILGIGALTHGVTNDQRRAGG